MSVVLPYKWEPRPYQVPLWVALQSGCKRAVAVWHRRAGKDLLAMQHLICSAMQRRGLYWHALPTYEQARKAIWDGQTKDGRPFIDHIPEELVQRKREDQMKVWLKNGSILQWVGADEYDRLVGANPLGIIFSEYALQDPNFWNLTRPMLAENDGWAVFISTPRGKNHLYRLFQAAQREPTWFSELLTVDDTGAVPMQVIDEDRRMGMPESVVQQEYWCSWTAELVGSIYGDLVASAHAEDRVTHVPWTPELPVSTAWDLGMADLTCVWFMQKVGMQRRFIDFMYGSGHGLEHYVKKLQEKPYVYDTAYLPHDAKVRELGTGKSRLEVLRSLGLRCQVVRKLSLEDGIQASRVLLPRSYFDAQKCDVGLTALGDYKRAEKKGEYGPNGEPVFENVPEHNFASHPADAFRTAAVAEKSERFEHRGSRSLVPELPIA